MAQKVTKAVIAAAGFGTRFLPQTKAMPKEMLPLVDKPIIQYVVEELVDAGIEDIIIVTGYHKRSIEDHFDYLSADLRKNLKDSGKLQILDKVKRISDLANFAYIRQKGPYGNATPLINAEHLIGDEPFVFAFADDFVKAEPSRFKQLIEVHESHGGSVLTCVRARTEEDYSRYGIVGGDLITPSLMDVKTIIEKPGSSANAPSDFASVSGYLFEPELFRYLHEDEEKLEDGKEFIMQTSIQRMINDGHKFYGCEIMNGKFYDTGNKLEYLKTVVDFAIAHEELGEDFKAYLRDLRF
ncbi:MAG: Nucleotidyl transferase [Candidatus Saccharibacteria bacterium]|nr:Nucleotidyl transferase [Candidatus Saccharibacteria bacterium]